MLTGGLDQTQTIPVPVDPTTLRSIAHATGGRFSDGATPAAMKQVYKDLGSHAAHERKNHEITAVVVGLALLLILPAILLSGMWFRRIA